MIVLMRHICVIMAVIAGLIISTNVYADEFPEGFIPLHGKHTNARGKVVAPMRNAPPRFMSLLPRNFRALPSPAAARRELPVETAELAQLSEHDAEPGDDAWMTTEQAQQIISIFDPNH